MREIETIRMDMISLQATVLKYNKLVGEIESNASKSDMLVTAMKLGMFFENAIGIKLLKEIVSAEFATGIGPSWPDLPSNT